MKKHLYFREKQVDSFPLECYTPFNLKTWIDRGAVCMSIFHHKLERVPGEGKRVYCRRVYVSRAYISGPYGKYPADCHNYVECYHSGFGDSLPVAVNVEFLRIRGFFVEKTERK